MKRQGYNLFKEHNILKPAMGSWKDIDKKGDITQQYGTRNSGHCDSKKGRTTTKHLRRKKMLVYLLLVAASNLVPAVAVPHVKGFLIPVQTFELGHIESDPLGKENILTTDDITDIPAEEDRIGSDIKLLEEFMESSDTDSENGTELENETDSEVSSSEETDLKESSDTDGENGTASENKTDSEVSGTENIDESAKRRDKRWIRVVGTGIKKTYQGTKKGVGTVYRGTKKGVGAVYRGTKKGVSAVWRGTKWGLKKTWRGIQKTDKYTLPLLFLEIPGDTRMDPEEYDVYDEYGANGDHDGA